MPPGRATYAGCCARVRVIARRGQRYVATSCVANLEDIPDAERSAITGQQCPTFDTTPFVEGSPLFHRRVALVSNAGTSQSRRPGARVTARASKRPWVVGRATRTARPWRRRSLEPHLSFAESGIHRIAGLCADDRSKNTAASALDVRAFEYARQREIRGFKGARPTLLSINHTESCSHLGSASSKVLG